MNKKHDSLIDKIDFDNKDVIEIGSGYGDFSLKHFLNAKSVFCIDTSREAVEYLADKWPVAPAEQKSAFQEGNIVELSLDGKEFDVVVFSNSF